MMLPKNLLNNGTYAKPRIFLCETNKDRICQLETSNTNGSFKFNSYSELTFEVGRTYNDVLTGEQKINPYYDKIEALRLIYLEEFGYFELQAPELISSGIKESKSCTAYSLEHTLSQKYLEDFYINTGEVQSVEVTVAKDGPIVPVVLYDQSRPELSLLHLVLEKAYGWSIGYVDQSLQKLSRQFEIDRQSIYDFLMNEVCQKFNCYITFDTINNKINVYAESLTSKFIGDGTTSTFTISPPFAQIGTVSVGGYKTTRWDYDITTGALVLEDVPESGVMVEIVDGALTKWETDVFVTFDNLSQEINVNYEADSIKTVLTVTYGDDNNIREANLGLPYLTDLSYYYTVDWMGQDLYDAYTIYQQKCNQYQAEYTKNSQEMLEVSNHMWFEENRLSLEYSVALSVNEKTVGTYYVRGGTAPNYYYTEVSLPAEYVAGTIYYSTETVNLQHGTDGNVAALLTALQTYFYNSFNLRKADENDPMREKYQESIQGALDDINEMTDRFAFMGGNYTIANLYAILKDSENTDDADADKEAFISGFFNKMFDEVGRIILKTNYYEVYKSEQIRLLELGYSQDTNVNYGYYYVVILLLNSIEAAIAKRDAAIAGYEEQYNDIAQKNANISNELLMDNNFTDDQLIRLSAFLREDELHLDDIVETSQDSMADSFKIKQDAMESGRIELSKICQPQLQFSMTMANIYALPEFEPIVGQFQLGNVIKVGLRSDYIKQSRLLQVDIGFDNFSDFSCEFGELTSLRSQSDIHADLLKKAVQAGKSVATNASYWTKGSDQANSIDLRLQEGLLNSIDALKSLDGTQHSEIDKYGIHLQKIDPVTGEKDPEQAWLVNNQIVFTDDAFKTSKAALGKFKVDEKTYYGLIAQAVIAGYVEGSKIRGGTIQIGEQTDGTYAFEVNADGSVIMSGGSSISGYAKEDDVNQLKDSATIVSETQPESANEGQMWLNTSTTPYTLMVFNNGEWVYFDQQEGVKIHTKEPTAGEFSAGDIWILATGETYINNDITYTEGSVLKAGEDLVWRDSNSTLTTLWSNINQTFTFNPNAQGDDLPGLTIGQKDEAFKVNINSQSMNFYEGDTIVVQISNKSANIDNLTVDGSFVSNGSSTFKGDTAFEKTVSGANQRFVWQVEESNGSFSLAFDS